MTLGEIGDFTHFKNGFKLVALADIDLTVKQSGEFIRTKNKMSKRLSPYLKRALWLALMLLHLMILFLVLITIKNIKKINIILLPPLC
ncbi:transposase [Clostridiisalibacter paucivorans]|uniref:transposase n=1 Tax=Clostridiisalibacter paucivorans TaxID=408753 RepID=UPI000A061E89